MTSSQWLDIAIIGVALIAAISGWRSGALGSLLSFVGVITQIKVDFTMFSEAGKPLRRDVSITMMGRSFSEDAAPDSFFAATSS